MIVLFNAATSFVSGVAMADFAAAFVVQSVFVHVVYLSAGDFLCFH
jgi:hypothetical protein